MVIFKVIRHAVILLWKARFASYQRKDAASELAQTGSRLAIGPLRRALQDSDVGVAVAAARSLNQLRVRARTDQDRALFALAKSELDVLPDTGAEGVRVMVRYLKERADSHSALQSCHRALKRTLERTKASLAAELLQEVVAIEDISSSHTITNDCGHPVGSRTTIQVDFAEARQVARQELIQRNSRAMQANTRGVDSSRSHRSKDDSADDGTPGSGPRTPSMDDIPARKAWVSKTKNSSLLRDIALGKDDLSVRKLAVERMSEEVMVVEVALSGTGEVAAAALERLLSPKSLQRVAIEASSSRVAVLALRRCAARLHEVIAAKERGSLEWKLVRGQAQSMMGEIAVDGQGLDTRLEAVGLVESQQVLARVAIESVTPAVAKRAAERVTDPEQSLRILEKCGDPAIQRMILETIKKPEQARGLYREGAPMGLRRLLAEELEDQEFLFDVALNDESPTVRLAAVKNLKDREVLDGVAEDDSDPKVRMQAARQAGNERIVARELAKRQFSSPGSTDLSATDLDEIQGALRCIDDESLLTMLASKGEAAETRVLAIERLIAVIERQDQDRLCELARQGEPVTIRLGAVEALSRFSCQVTLAEIAVHDPDASVREAALDKLDDVATLSRIADDLGDGDVQRALSQRIKTLGGLPEAFLLLQRAEPADLITTIAELAAFSHQVTLAHLARHTLIEVRAAAAANLWDHATLRALSASEGDPTVRGAIEAQLKRHDAWQAAYHRLLKLRTNEEADSQSISFEEACALVTSPFWGGSVYKSDPDLDTPYDSGCKGYGSGYREIVRTGDRRFATKSGSNWTWLD